MLRLVLVACLIHLAGQAAACRLPSGAEETLGALLAELNSFRTSNGLQPVLADPRLQRAAGSHACDSATRGRMGHDGSDGSTLSDRVARQGYDFREIAENVAMGYPSAQAVLRGWIDSRGHRRNMLMRRAQDAGLGLAIDAKGEMHWVLVLGRD